ncbi:hypothetical protein ACH5RR_002132 [Cinchona calisaya]|uniref:MADS-box domain-containing protein n=1 Tax=Cinchona calisaya TaxID=153742 RepID=A0ABD3B5S6_9GENT
MATGNKRGRPKINLVKIEDETNRLVTFSKRRAGIFKKASELSTLCGGEIAVVLFSPANRVHCFGHPSVESVINKFIKNNNNGDQNDDDDDALKNYREAKARELNEKLVYYQSIMEAEEERAKIFAAERKENEKKYWWMAPLEKLNLEQLIELEKKYEGIRKSIANFLAAEAASSSHNVAEENEPGVNLDLTLRLGPSGYAGVSEDKAEGSNAGKFQKFL